VKGGRGGRGGSDGLEGREERRERVGKRPEEGKGRFFFVVEKSEKAGLRAATDVCKSL